jgi:hypothetical protein
MTMVTATQSGMSGGGDQEERDAAELYASDQQVRDARPIAEIKPVSARRRDYRPWRMRTRRQPR